MVLSDLILHKEKIDLLWVHESKKFGVKIKDKDFISRLLEKSLDIGVSKLSKEQEKDFLTKFKDNTFILIDFHDEDSNNPAYGRFIIWEDGTIFTEDITTERSLKRTVSYLALDKYPEFYEWIKSNVQINN